MRNAIDEHATTRQARLDAEALRQCLGSLTSREREVLVALAAGKLDKQIAAALGRERREL